MAHPTSASYVFADSPRNVYWEMTGACSLACKHCRAHAVPNRAPEELTTEEGYRLIDSVKALGSLLVLTGGDPLERPDLVELVAYARSLHVPVAITPSTTPTLTLAVVEQMKELGVAALGVSIDGPTPEVHDHFRGVPGTFGHSMNALAWAREASLPVQVNTTVTKVTRPHLEALFELLCENSPPVRRWSLFVLVPTGRGTSLTALRPAELEHLFGWVYEVSRTSRFHLSLVEAPHYRRYWLEREQANGVPTAALAARAARMGFGVRDGNGVVFVARNGDVFPAGFLPNPCLGNVRTTPLETLYRDAPALQALRDMDQLRGRCGRCRYRWLCGGSRARAWAASADLLGEDPACVYAPPAIRDEPWPAPAGAPRRSEAVGA